jgi:hypothetical protein
MTNNVIRLRRPAVPASSWRPRLSSRRPSSSTDTVRITIDDGRGVHLAVCENCTHTESAYPDSLGWLLDWADSHECDRELAELLAVVCGRGAA